MLRSDSRLLGLAVALSGLAGFVDALGFLSAGGFFVSFMSGNSTRLSAGLVAGTSAASSAAGLILGFVAGVTLGALVGAKAGSARRRHVVLGLVTTLLCLAALSAPYSMTVALALMVMAMGAENAALGDNGEVKVGLTYMTGALVRLGQAAANRLTGADASHWYVDLGLWGGLMIGAITGATAYAYLAMASLWIAAALALILTIIAFALRPSSRSQT
jgi:uncharacterized membrane protein YoaK (UPF0700 family)